MKAKARTTHRETTGQKTIQILIVDDHPVVRRGLVGMINQEADLNVCCEAEDYYESLKTK